MLSDRAKTRMAEIVDKFDSFDGTYSGSGVADNLLESRRVRYVRGGAVKDVCVVNTVPPDGFRTATEELETFARNELGVWALQYSRGKLVELSAASEAVGDAKWEERTVVYSNLALATNIWKATGMRFSVEKVWADEEFSGAVWAVIPALFKAKWGTNETLFTLMMNYIATFLVAYFLVIWVPSGSSSLGKQKYGKLPVIGNDYLLIILIVLALTIGLYIYLNYTKHGYEISVVGESVRTARYIGINEGKVIIRTMILSGALCGLAGYLIAAGLDQTVTTESAGGQGFTGIMVAWLGKFNPLAMMLTAGLIQVLNQGAGQISQDFDVSGALPSVITGIILFFINYEVHFRGHGGKRGKEGVK